MNRVAHASGSFISQTTVSVLSDLVPRDARRVCRELNWLLQADFVVVEWPVYVSGCCVCLCSLSEGLGTWSRVLVTFPKFVVAASCDNF